MSNDLAFSSPPRSEPATHTNIGDDKYETHVIPNPSHPYVCHFGNICAAPHWHENLEVLFFHGDGGIICERTSYALQKGDIAVVNSNTLHAIPKCGSTTHDCLIIDGAFLAKCDINISEIKFVCTVRDQTAAELFFKVTDEIQKASKGDEYAAASVKAAILTLTVYLCRGHSTKNVAESVRADAIKRAIGYIKSHYDEALTVEQIARQANVSKFYFCREFRRETGYTVVHYINNLRCREAEKLLRSGKHTVGQAARMCGFENLPYFTRTYKAIIGCPPSASRSTECSKRAKAK